MRISRIRIRNFGPFRGEHVLELDAKVYAVVARRTQDAESSNWAGKTTFLEAFEFVLYGAHRYRTEDEFISRGEAQGEVEIVLDDGTRILRTRERGKRTTVHYFPSDGTPAAIQAEADAAIVRMVGLNVDDSKSTFCFEQRMMAKFVNSDPAERMKMVSGWFRLEPLERCEARTRELASALEDAAKKIDGHVAALDQRESDIARKDAEGKPVWTREKIVETVPLLEADLERRRGFVANLEDQLQKNAVLMASKGRIADYEQVVEEGKKVRADLETRKLPLLQETWAKAENEAKEIAVEVGSLVRDAHAKGELAKGNFDGKCPVAGIACPAKTQINESFEHNRNLASAANEKYRAADQRLTIAKTHEQNARAGLQQAQRIEQRLLALREQAGRLAPLAKAAMAGGEPEDPTTLRARLEKERGYATEVRIDIERMKSWKDELEKIEQTRIQLAAKRTELETQLGVYREAAVIFGKRGAQRRVAEGALGQIEADANEVLKECGVDLRVEVRWSREGKGLATACDACGAPFPSSAKIKHCERCGTARGPKLENKLELVLSDRSGAAEDLAGAAVQLAASRWLREERGTSWSTALIDEPFGSLDSSNRKAFASHLATMLAGRYSLTQAFVVAHHSSVLDSLPGRILITNDGKWSKIEVVA